MIGDRLRQARKASSMSLRELAEQVGLSHTAIDKFERDINTPNSTMLLKLSEALRVSVDYLLRPPTVELKKVGYRSHKGFTLAKSERILADVTDKVERQLELYDLVPGTLPAFKKPRIPTPVASLDEVEDVAEKVRETWNLGLNPIPDLFDTLEEHGVIVLQSHVISANTFSGLSAWAGKIPVIIVSTEWPADRQRFTACHELGHLLLQGKLSPELDEEKACDRFAGAFLVPKPSVVSALGENRKWIDHRELALLKAEYGLSMNAWLYRAKDCGVISPRKAGQLFGYFKKRGWDKHEPGEACPPEAPRRFPQTVFRAVAEDIIGESKAAELLAVSRPSLQRMRADADCP